MKGALRGVLRETRVKAAEEEKKLKAREKAAAPKKKKKTILKKAKHKSQSTLHNAGTKFLRGK